MLMATNLLQLTRLSNLHSGVGGGGGSGGGRAVVATPASAVALNGRSYTGTRGLNIRSQPEGTRPPINNSPSATIVNLPSGTFLISNAPMASVTALWSPPSESVSTRFNPATGEPLGAITEPTT